MTIDVDTGHVRLQSAQCATTSRCGPAEVAGTTGMFEVCLVRSGCFDYRDSRGRVRVDSSVAIMGMPRQAGEVAHPVDGGDTTTIVMVTPDVMATLGVDDDLGLAAWVTPSTQLLHRRLVCSAGGGDGFRTEELAIRLIDQVLTTAEPVRPDSGYPATENARRAAVDHAREALVADPSLASIVELGRRVGVSPHHLSRIFTGSTGRSISTFRTELRIGSVLESLTEAGEAAASFADLAAQHGFSDHAHLTRTFRRHLSATPSQVRATLRADDGTHSR